MALPAAQYPETFSASDEVKRNLRQSQEFLRQCWRLKRIGIAVVTSLSVRYIPVRCLADHIAA
jgi:hypothetical protein